MWHCVLRDVRARRVAAPWGRHGRIGVAWGGACVRRRALLGEADGHVVVDLEEELHAVLVRPRAPLRQRHVLLGHLLARLRCDASSRS